MAKVLGVGGVFFKSKNPSQLYSWYEKYLGIEKKEGAGISFQNASNYVVLSIFDSNTKYFSPPSNDYMINLVVDDLEGALKQVAEGGAEIVGEIESYFNGRFGWFIDPDGNKIELWEPNGQ